MLNKQIFNPKLYSSIRSLWFAGVDPKATVPPQSAMQRWFARDPAARDLFDGQCRDGFKHALDDIGPANFPLTPPTELSDPQDYEKVTSAFAHDINAADHVAQLSEEEACLNTLSLILLFDQMPRNIFRAEQGLIYSHYDRIARALSRHALKPEGRLDRHPSTQAPTYRMWITMPLVHSENLEDHKRFASVFDEMKEEMTKKDDKEALAMLSYFDEIEGKHVQILEQFGRYPYRNKALGRESTAEEQKWIDDGGETFGA